MSLLSIDGKEGGGQLLRTALAMSTLTGIPFEITNIRATRPEPGLKAQHLTCITALRDWTGAKADGNEIGSTRLLFVPGQLKPKTVSIDIGTAGSITLLMQSLLLPALFTPGTVRFSIKGGTDVNWSLSWDYFANVIVPHYRSLGTIELTLIKRGYYPKGNGEVKIRVVPTNHSFENLPEMKPMDLLERGILHAIRGVSHASSDLEAREVSERQARACHHIFTDMNLPVNITSNYQNTDSTGSGTTVWAHYSNRPDEINQDEPVVIGADSLGSREKSAEEVGEKAGNELRRIMEKQACVDDHALDNLVPLLAIRGGQIKYDRLTNHAKANMDVVTKFLGTRFQFSDNLLKVVKN